jgi:hypothetical protein
MRLANEKQLIEAHKKRLETVDHTLLTIEEMTVAMEKARLNLRDLAR